ncbi:shikimate kinase 1 [bacterium BMS3Bbin14]|nr:shikimate kinase 1 [bacterium BMS3Abin13]GBE51844.1 shikimate kinase 1 [bacterium BMS3Bbin14]HDK43877.1 shikimate kinase [Desulfobacteraceae bacterium]
MFNSCSNIILIGMAGSGKSTIGSLLARKLSCRFIDTDTLIEQAQNRTLQEIIEILGPMGFRRIEEQVLLRVNLKDHVIATGGSSIYSHAGMMHLKKNGLVILLDVALPVLEARLHNLNTRGLVKFPDQSFADLFAERLPLYKKYADRAVACLDMGKEEICERIIEMLNNPESRAESGMHRQG